MKRPITITLIILVSMAMMLGIVFYNASHDVVPLLFNDTKIKASYDFGSIIKGVVYFLAMFVGIIFGRIYRALASSNEGRVNIVNDIKSTLNSKPFVKAVLASPIVFGVIYTTISAEATILMSLIFSFQNGFFCDGVINAQMTAAERAIAKENPGTETTPKLHQKAKIDKSE